MPINELVQEQPQDRYSVKNDYHELKVVHKASDYTSPSKHYFVPSTEPQLHQSLYTKLDLKQPRISGSHPFYDLFPSQPRYRNSA